MSGKFQNAIKSIMFTSQSLVEQKTNLFIRECLEQIWSQIGKQKKSIKSQDKI